MDPRRPGFREGPRQLDAIAGPLDDVVVGALAEPHGTPAEDVHGRDHLDLGLQPPF